MQYQTRLNGRCISKIIAALVFTVLAVFLIGGSAYAVPVAVPVLWGIDEDRGELFTIEDYNSGTPIFTSYGTLQFGGSDVDHDIEGLTLDKFGMMFIALNDPIADLKDPVLLTFDTTSAVLPTGSDPDPNSVQVEGRMNDFDKVNGLAIDPLTEQLFGLGEEDDDWFLFRIDNPNNPAAVTVIDTLNLEKGEELEFDEFGNLFITDDNENDENILYQVELLRNSSDIINGVSSLDVLIGDLEDEFPGRDEVKFEGLAWDPLNHTMLGFSDRKNFWANLIGAGSTSEYAALNSFGLTDVEGIAFEQQSRNQVPEPGTMILLGVGLLGLAGLRRTVKRS